MNVIRTRYGDGNIYTYSGIVLTSVNPYRHLSVYEREVIWAYNERRREELEPHLFAIAEEAYQSLRKEGKSQSIIVSGESGAGKTISAKYIMRYLAELCSDESPILGEITLDFKGDCIMGEGSTKASLEDKILATNPILEAFGNSKTLKNDNSSRFGKYIQIYFDSESNIVGAALRSFLLEKTRVVSQAPGERNFHIFYQLLKGCPELERNELLLLERWKDYRYLANSGTSDINGIDDGQEFKITSEAMSIAGFTKEHQFSIFRVIAAILLLGNIDFEEDHQGYALIKDRKTLDNTARLLGLNSDKLMASLLKRRLTTATETVDALHSIAQATATRDIFAKHLYSQVFDHIIGQLNSILSPYDDVNHSNNFIGVLDIYGFERFKVDSFEQFCINYANEKLQNMFNLHVFDLEQKLYTEEGIIWSFIDFADNRLCTDLIEGKLGILDLLDEECRFPTGSDESFVRKLLEYHQHGRTEQAKYLYHPKLAANNIFAVRHFAYEVEYSAEHFLEKNRDTLAPDMLVSLLSSSSYDFIKNLCHRPDNDSCSTTSSPKKRSREPTGGQWKHSTGNLFKQSLNELMNTLYATRVHYIRCIKPNEDKAPFQFNAPFVMQQLQACGVLETIRISAAGYPGRWTFDDFVERFSLLASDPVSVRIIENHREACVKLLDDLMMSECDFQVGKTRIFMRAGVLGLLEMARTTKLAVSAKIIQASTRRDFARFEYETMKRSSLFIFSYVKKHLGRLLYDSLCRERAINTVISYYIGHVATCYRRRAIVAASILCATFRFMLSIRSFSTVREQQARQCLSQTINSLYHHRWFKRSLRIALVIQSRYRQTVAWMALLKLREEAFSYEHLKETFKSQSRRLTDLTLQLRLAEEHLLYERSVNNSLREKFLNQTKPDDTNLNERIHELEIALVQLKEKLVEAQLSIESYQNMVENLEVANNELFEKNENLLKQLRVFRLEKLNADQISTASDKKLQQSLANILLRDTFAPPKTLRHLRVLSFDSRLSQLYNNLELPEITRPATVYLAEGKSHELATSLNDAGCLNELVHIVTSAKYDGENEFIPAKVFSLWILSWLRVGSNSNLVQSYLAQILNNVKMVLMGSNPQRRPSELVGRPVDADAKIAFWIANLFDFLCFLQYAVVDTMEHQKDPAEAPSDQMAILMQLRTDVARAVEELCRVWLADLFRTLLKMGVSALLDYQGLSGFGSDQASPVIAGKSSLRLLIRPFMTTGGARNNSVREQCSIDDLVNTLGRLAQVMKTSHLQQELAMQIMTAVMTNICSSSFNQLILRKNYATWKRGIQIQYNISRLEEWATTLNANHPSFFFSASTLTSPITSPVSGGGSFVSSGSPLVCIEPLVQAVKLLQLAKTRAASDIDILIAACPRLRLAQIRKILSVYVPDIYEDGPVAPEVLRALTLRIEEQEKEREKGETMETLPEVQPQILPLQLSIRPMPPTAFEKLPSNVVPPLLWKIFALLNSAEQKESATDDVDDGDKL